MTDSGLRRLKAVGVTAFRNTECFVGREKEIGCLGVAFSNAFVIRLFGKCVPTKYTLEGDQIGIGKALSSACC